MVRTIGGRYAIEGRLGEGGMGLVYRVRHTQLAKQFALKVISPAFAKDEKLVVASINRGVPFIISQKAAPISRAIHTLAGRIVEVLAPQNDPSPSRRWPAFGAN